jgi:hypothetical protein
LFRPVPLMPKATGYKGYKSGLLSMEDTKGESPPPRAKVSRTLDPVLLFEALM